MSPQSTHAVGFGVGYAFGAQRQTSTRQHWGVQHEDSFVQDEDVTGVECVVWKSVSGERLQVRSPFIRAETKGSPGCCRWAPQVSSFVHEVKKGMSCHAARLPPHASEQKVGHDDGETSSQRRS